MSTRDRHGFSVPLADVRRRFELWRRSRKVGSRIPEALWDAAVNTAKRHGVAQTARALRVDYYTLKSRLEGKPGKRVEAASSLAASEEPVAATFLELPTPARTTLPECILELEDAEGCKMRIHLKGIEAPDLSALSRSLWEIGS
jgi:hypothetical protein